MKAILALFVLWCVFAVTITVGLLVVLFMLAWTPLFFWELIKISANKLIKAVEKE